MYVDCATWIKRDVEFINSAAGKAMEWPSANVHSNAKSLGVIAAMMANNGRTLQDYQLLTPEVVKLAMSEPKIDHDKFMGATYSFTKGGFSNFGDFHSVLTPSDFHKVYNGFSGWCGLGGSLFLWDSSRRVGFTYTMNGKTLQLISGPRGDRIMKSTQKVLSDLKPCS